MALVWLGFIMYYRHLQREALGFLFAMQQVWIRGWRMVWFEGDSLELDRIINQVSCSTWKCPP